MTLQSSLLQTTWSTPSHVGAVVIKTTAPSICSNSPPLRRLVMAAQLYAKRTCFQTCCVSQRVRRTGYQTRTSGTAWCVAPSSARSCSSTTAARVARAFVTTARWLGVRCHPEVGTTQCAFVTTVTGNLANCSN